MAKKEKRTKIKSKNTQRKGKKNIVFGLFVGLGVLILILILLLMISFNVFEHNETRMFSIKDECSIVVGNLIHQIRNNGECRIKCVNECDVRKMNFEKFDFTEKDNECNSCECWCD